MNQRLWAPLLGLAVLALAGSVMSAKKPAVKLETATFAGGCFWCMQPPFEQLPGVVEVWAGYTGGTGKDATYDDYIAKGHTEAVQLKYDPSKISYERLLDVFWRQINPTDANGQFADRGPGYYAGIYYHDEKQKAAAEKSKEALGKSGRFDGPILTKILKYGVFYRAEDYHQGYYKKNAEHYKRYKKGSGRADYIEKMWGKDAP